MIEERKLIVSSLSLSLSLMQVVGQIDKLTSDFDFDQDPDDWTVATASSTSSSERGLGEAFRLDFLSQDMLSDGWDFCNFLEASNRKAQREETDEGQERPSSSTASVYSQMNGGLPVPNGPLIITQTPPARRHPAPLTARKLENESALVTRSSTTPCAATTMKTRRRTAAPRRTIKWTVGPQTQTVSPVLWPVRLPNTRWASITVEKRRPRAPRPWRCRWLALTRYPGKVFSTRAAGKKLLRNSSTQTVSDKSTQTVLPYIPAKQKNKDLWENSPLYIYTNGLRQDYKELYTI